ncbi:MAG: family 16 glycoside hydrolase [Verrucomicrobiota bacterium]|nr:DUF1080 domain-containing protein [Limisphaerales bacterium]
MLSRILWLWLAFLGSATAAELAFDFSAVPARQIPPGFTNLVAGKGKPGDWRVITDEFPSALPALNEKTPTMTQRSVLGQFSIEVTDEHFPILLYDREPFTDFTLTTKFKLVDGVVEQMAGIVFRLQDEKNFYVIRASGLGNNVRFYKMVAGLRSAPLGPELPVPRGVWHELKIECQGNRIHAWLNGQEAIPTLTDTSFAAGKIGFWTKSDAISYFTDTKITYIPRETLAQVLVRDTVAKNPRLVGLKIYLCDENGEPRVAASKDAKEVGAAGGDAEKQAIAGGKIFYGKGRDTVAVVQPLRDRNGEPIAAVRVTMKSFTGQTEQSALQRALPIVKGMQSRVRNLAELKD